jgi:hypothetical protein
VDNDTRGSNSGGQMRFLLDNYFLPYTDGMAELNFTLAQPVALSEILAKAKIPIWEHYQFVINGKTTVDLTELVSDGDEVKIIPEN